MTRCQIIRMIRFKLNRNQDNNFSLLNDKFE